MTIRNVHSASIAPAGVGGNLRAERAGGIRVSRQLSGGFVLGYSKLGTVGKPSSTRGLFCVRMVA